MKQTVKVRYQVSNKQIGTIILTATSAEDSDVIISRAMMTVEKKFGVTAVRKFFTIISRKNDA